MRAYHCGWVLEPYVQERLCLRFNIGCLETAHIKNGTFQKSAMTFFKQHVGESVLFEERELKEAL